MKFGIFAALISAALLAMACQLSGGATALPTPTATVILATPTFIIPATSTPAVTATASSTVRPTVGGSTGGIPCFPRNDWPVYLVQRGDTLGILAQRTGTTAAALAAANCLTDINTLYAGQALRIPFVPTLTFTPTLTSLPPTATPIIIVVTATPSSTLIPPP